MAVTGEAPCSKMGFRSLQLFVHWLTFVYPPCHACNLQLGHLVVFPRFSSRSTFRLCGVPFTCVHMTLSLGRAFATKAGKIVDFPDPVGAFTINNLQALSLMMSCSLIFHAGRDACGVLSDVSLREFRKSVLRWYVRTSEQSTGTFLIKSWSLTLKSPEAIPSLSMLINCSSSCALYSAHCSHSQL